MRPLSPWWQPGNEKSLVNFTYSNRICWWTIPTHEARHRNTEMTPYSNCTLPSKLSVGSSDTGRRLSLRRSLLFLLLPSSSARGATGATHFSPVPHRFDIVHTGTGKVTIFVDPRTYDSDPGLLPKKRFDSQVVKFPSFLPMFQM